MKVTAYAADWITHSAVAGLVATALHGEGLLINALALLLGFATHATLDLTVNEFKAWPPARFWPWYATQVIVVTVLIVLSPPLAVWAIIGGLLPDIIDGVYGFIINKDAWMRGDLLFWFHRPRGATSTQSLKANIIVVVIAVLLYVGVIWYG